MKILHINATDILGSTGTIIKNINNYLEEHYPYFNTFIASRDGKTEGNSFRYINDAEYFIIRAARKLFGKTLFGTFLPTKRLIRYIDSISPDIIHLHVIHHQSLNYKMLFKYLKTFKGKVFYTLHDCWPFSGGCYHYSEAGCDGFLTGCVKCPQNAADLDCLRSAVKREFDFKKKALNEIPNITFVAVSDWLAGEAKKSFLKEKEILTVHNGINAEIFKPLDLPKNDRFTVISAASCWTPRKHLDILLKLAKELSDVDFIVVGQVGNEKNQAQYPNVRFYGRTASAEELCRLYNSADVFANFSTEETFGLVTAEAMACGLPVVAFNKTACGEAVGDDCGFVVDGIDNYRDALLSLKNSDLSKYKNTCRKRVEDLYTTEIMCKHYADLYKKYYDLKSRESFND